MNDKPPVLAAIDALKQGVHCTAAKHPQVKQGMIKALAELQKWVGDNGWKPIETAPRDGTAFIGYSPTHKIHHNVSWNANYERFDPNGYSCLMSNWTHWQPQLTTPPKENTK